MELAINFNQFMKFGNYFNKMDVGMRIAIQKVSETKR